MSDLTPDAAKVIVVVRMADDLHHTLGRIAQGLSLVWFFFLFAALMDTLDNDWWAVGIDLIAAAWLFSLAYDTWKRRKKYAPLVTRTTPPATDTPTRRGSKGES